MNVSFRIDTLAMVIAVLRRILPMAVFTPMRAGGVARAARAGGALAATIVSISAFTACSPTYDWRTISNNDSGYSVDLPAKPGTDERQIDVNGAPMRMRMQTAEVADDVFVVGTLELPDAQPATQQKALAFLRAGLARNVGAAVSTASSTGAGAARETQTVAVPLATGGAIEGVELRVAGKAGANGETRTIHARLVAKGARAYEVAIVGRAEPLAEQVEQFFGSFKLY